MEYVLKIEYWNVLIRDGSRARRALLRRTGDEYLRSRLRKQGLEFVRELSRTVVCDELEIKTVMVIWVEVMPATRSAETTQRRPTPTAM